MAVGLPKPPKVVVAEPIEVDYVVDSTPTLTPGCQDDSSFGKVRLVAVNVDESRDADGNVSAGWSIQIQHASGQTACISGRDAMRVRRFLNVVFGDFDRVMNEFLE